MLGDCCCCSVSKSCLTHCDPMDCSPPGSLSMGFSGQEYWSGLPFPSPGGLPNPGIEPRSPAISGRFFTVWGTRTAIFQKVARKFLAQCLFFSFVCPFSPYPVDTLSLNFINRKWRHSWHTVSGFGHQRQRYWESRCREMQKKVTFILALWASLTGHSLKFSKGWHGDLL